MSAHGRPGRLAMQLAAFGMFVLVGLFLRWTELDDTEQARAIAWAAGGFVLGSLFTGVIVIGIAARRRVDRDRGRGRETPAISTWVGVAIGLLAAAVIRGPAIDAIGGSCVGFCLVFALYFRSRAHSSERGDEVHRP